MKIRKVSFKKTAMKIGQCLLFFGLLVFRFEGSQTEAQNIDPDSPFSNLPSTDLYHPDGPTNTTGRPQFPADFDLETVQKLIADIDKPRNATILKVGYFLRRGSPSLPTDKGYALLVKARDQEQPGSRRWFLMQNLIGFAAFRIETGQAETGFDAYKSVFEHAPEADKANSTYILRQTISEYVGLVGGKLKDLSSAKDPQVKECLFRAWTAYSLNSSDTKPGVGKTAAPNWAAALDASDSKKDFIPYINKVLEDQTVQKTFSLLYASANVLEAEEPGKAIGLYGQAALLLGQQKEKIDNSEMGQFFSNWVDLLIAQNQLEAAIKAQRERIRLIANGRAKLLMLTEKVGNQDEVVQVVNDLKSPEVNDDDINDSADFLLALNSDSKNPNKNAGDQAESILLAYLNNNRVRNYGQELRARLTLSQFYIAAKRRDDTKKILEFSPPKEILSLQDQNRWLALQKVKEQINN